MANIIELIKVLRDRTGAGMMDCKKALLCRCPEPVPTPEERPRGQTASTSASRT